MLAVILLTLSVALLVASLWQIEICTGWVKDESGFDFPFYIRRGVNRWWARDFWYAVNMAAWTLGVVSGCLLEV